MKDVTDVLPVQVVGGVVPPCEHLVVGNFFGRLVNWEQLLEPRRVIRNRKATLVADLKTIDESSSILCFFGGAGRFIRLDIIILPVEIINIQSIKSPVHFGEQFDTQMFILAFKRKSILERQFTFVIFYLLHQIRWNKVESMPRVHKGWLHINLPIGTPIANDKALQVEFHLKAFLLVTIFSFGSGIPLHIPQVDIISQVWGVDASITLTSDIQRVILLAPSELWKSLIPHGQCLQSIHSHLLICVDDLILLGVG